MYFYMYFYCISICIFTGEVMREIKYSGTRPMASEVRDMCIDGDTLITPRYNEKNVLYYKLNYEQ